MKKRWRLLAVLVLALLIASLVISCADSSIIEKVTIAWTAEQIIASVQVLGLPHYFTGQQTTPIGHWAAVYEGEDTWRVRGSILTIYENRDYVRTTIWLHTSSQIELLDVAGDVLPAGATAEDKPKLSSSELSLGEIQKLLEEARNK